MLNESPSTYCTYSDNDNLIFCCRYQNWGKTSPWEAQGKGSLYSNRLCPWNFKTLLGYPLLIWCIYGENDNFVSVVDTNEDTFHDKLTDWSQIPKWCRTYLGKILLTESHGFLTSSFFIALRHTFPVIVLRQLMNQQDLICDVSWMQAFYVIHSCQFKQNFFPSLHLSWIEVAKDMF